MTDNQYFSNLYAKLKSQSTQLPNDDPSPNIQSCIEQPNFIRAEMLAKQHNLSSDIVVALQELAILQYLVDYKNVSGLVEIANQFDMTSGEFTRIMDLAKQEKAYPCPSFSRLTEESINENWTTVYQPIMREVEEIIKPGAKRWFNWVLRLFKKN